MSKIAIVTGAARGFGLTTTKLFLSTDWRVAGQDIAETIVFLCSGKASYITGQVIAVDGGFDAAGVGLPALRTSRQ